MAKNEVDLSDGIKNDASIVSFVVRVWKEERSSETDESIWRGHITPIPNGTRHYFKNLDEISKIVLEHLNSSRDL